MNHPFYVAFVVVFAVLVIYCFISTLIYDATIQRLLYDVDTLKKHINELSRRIQNLENEDT